LEIGFKDECVLLAVVSDGAGSAEFSSTGSRLVVETFARSAALHFRTGMAVEEITDEIVYGWLDNVRERIYRAAEEKSVQPRQMAATLVAAIVCAERAIVCHVGDGACVVRRQNTKVWEVPSWPAHGEYASSTYFVTDDPQPRLQFVRIDDELSEVAVFSDGIERLGSGLTA
jgi:hypothetical protein